MNFFDNLVQIDLRKNIGIVGLTDEFFCVYLNDILKQSNKNILVVVNSLFEANNLYSSLSLYTDKARLFPMDDFLTSEALAISPDLRITRLETLNKIANNEPSIVITNLMGVLRFLPSKDTYINSVFALKNNDVVSPIALAEKLVKCGYTRDTIVTKTGEFAVRGFVVDIFPIDEDNPVRIEFFDDEVESIRYFDAETQKSLRVIGNILIKPFFEFLSTKTVEESKFGKQKYLPEVEKVVSISDYFEDGVVVFKDYEQLGLSYSHICEEMDTYRADKDITFDGNYMFSLDDIRPKFPIYYMTINNLVDHNKYSDVINFGVKTINNFSEDINQINSMIRKNISLGKTVIRSEERR